MLPSIPVFPQPIDGLLLACAQSLARGPTSSLPAVFTAEKHAGDQEQSGANGETSAAHLWRDGPCPSLCGQPVSYTLENEREGFALALETKEYSPEELSVKQMGRKLRVSGKTEKKPDDGEGSYSSRCQEFRQEFDLPDGVNPETVTCSLDHDGKLHIEP